LIPALYNLAKGNLLAREFALVGFARPEMTTEQFRATCSEQIQEFATGHVDPNIWHWFVRRLYYVSGEKIALPITIGAVRYPGIKIHDTRIIRLLEVLLHDGNTVGGWTAKQIHEAVVTTFQLSPTTYGLNQLRYDLRKLKGHGLLQRNGRRYVLPPYGQKALMSRSCSCSFTSASAARSLTAASITNLIRPTGPRANWRPPITKPTRPLRTSLICCTQPEAIRDSCSRFVYE
jgi:hypothetical protein